LLYYWYLDDKELKTGELTYSKTRKTLNFTLRSNYTSAGEYKIKFVVTDNNATLSRLWVLTIKDINAPPEIILYQPSLEKLTLTTETWSVFRAIAKDLDNDTLGYWWKVENDTLEYREDVNKSFIELAIELEPLKVGNYTLIVRFYELTNEPTLWVEHRWLLKVVNYSRLQEELSELSAELLELNNTIDNLTASIEELNSTLETLEEQLENLTAKISNLTTQLDELTQAKEDAEARAIEADRSRKEAISAKVAAEGKLAGSVIFAIFSGIIAGLFLARLLTKRKKK
jgi:prefoldin subunit 5